ncbi:MAG: DUF4010 domain-containing protein [Acidobacteria bacterium]|nr:MAG: DUF4010 domain-containing protein [Acidobacteriota bacterium]
MLVIIVSTISYSGYVLMRVMGRDRGLAASALVGGLVSTTAVTLSLADRANRTPALTRACGVSGVLANAVQFPRLLFLVWIVEPRLGRLLALPLLGGFAAGLAGAWVLGTLRRREDDPELEVALPNPYSLAAALRFAAMFVVVLFAARAATISLGDRGLYLASAVAGLVDASAISLTAADMAARTQLAPGAAAIAVVIAIATNALLKWILALANGTRELAFWLGGGFVTMVGTAALLLGVALLV